MQVASFKKRRRNAIPQVYELILILKPQYFRDPIFIERELNPNLVTEPVTLNIPNFKIFQIWKIEFNAAYRVL